MTNQLEKAEAENCKTFHDKYARTLNIPLTLQAYLYGDIEKKGPKAARKLERNSSFTSSKLSKESRVKEDRHNNITEIKEQFPEVDEEDEEQDFDL